jgi:hypothetical protein
MVPEVRTHLSVSSERRTPAAPAGRPLASGYPVTVPDSDDIPEELRRIGAVGPNGDIAWDPDDAIKVAQWLSQARRAVLGGDALGWFADGSVCDTLSSVAPGRRLVSGWDVRGRAPGEKWEDYCHFCLASAMSALRDPIKPEDVAEAVTAVRYRLSWRDSLGAADPEPLPGNPPALYWG